MFDMNSLAWRKSYVSGLARGFKPVAGSCVKLMDQFSSHIQSIIMFDLIFDWHFSARMDTPKVFHFKRKSAFSEFMG